MAPLQLGHDAARAELETLASLNPRTWAGCCTMKLTFGNPANAAVWKTLFTTTALTFWSTSSITTPGKSLLGCVCFHSSRFALRMLNSSSMRCSRSDSSTEREFPAGSAVDQDLAADDRHDRRVDHVEGVLGLGQLQALARSGSRRSR